MAFSAMASAQAVHAFSARSERRSALSGGVFANRWLWGAVSVCLLLQLAAVYAPPLQAALHTVPLAAADWAVVAGCALIPVAGVEAVKALAGRPAVRR
jgi:Ca2+-transporting ATPase